MPFLSFLDTSCVVELAFDCATYPMAPISQHIGLTDSVNQGSRGHLTQVEKKHKKIEVSVAMHPPKQFKLAVTLAVSYFTLMLGSFLSSISLIDFFDPNPIFDVGIVSQQKAKFLTF